jgi:hypothetical protein
MIEPTFPPVIYPLKVPNNTDDDEISVKVDIIIEDIVNPLRINPPLRSYEDIININ